MPKLKIYILLFFCTLNRLKAGDIGISASVMTSLKTKGDYIWVCRGANHTIVVKTNHSPVEYVTNVLDLLVFNNDGKTVKKEELSLKYNGSFLSADGLMESNGKVFLIASDFDYFHKLRTLYLVPIDTANIRFDLSNIQKIGTAKALGHKAVFIPIVRIVKSGDNSKSMIICPDDSPLNTRAPWNIWVLDNSLKPLWTTSLLGSSDQTYSFKNLFVDNRGKVYVIRTDKPKKKDQTNRSGTIHVLVMDSGKVMVNHEIPGISARIHSLHIGADTAGNIHLAGFYGDETETGVKGTVSMKIAPQTTSIPAWTIEELPVGISKMLVYNRRLKKGKDLWYYDRLQFFHQFPDGSNVLMAEEEDMLPTNSAINRGPVLIFVFNADGSLRLGRVLLKSQSGNAFLAEESYSIIPLFTNEKLYVLFSDDPANETAEKRPEIPYKFTSKFETQYAFEMDMQSGDMKRNKLKMGMAMTRWINPGVSRFVSATNSITLMIFADNSIGVGQAQVK